MGKTIIFDSRRTIFQTQRRGDSPSITQNCDTLMQEGFSKTTISGNASYINPAISIPAYGTSHHGYTTYFAKPRVAAANRDGRGGENIAGRLPSNGK